MAVRRVRRIIRRIDPWTVLKVSLVLNAIAALIFVLGTWVMWSLALRRGIPGRIVDIFESLTLTVTVDGELYFRIVVLVAIIGGILMTAFMTLGAVLYNLIADLVGGVEISVLEETYRPASTRTRMVPGARTSGLGGAVAASPPEQPAVQEGPPRAPAVTPAAQTDEQPAPEGDAHGEPAVEGGDVPRVRAG